MNYNLLKKEDFQSLIKGEGIAARELLLEHRKGETIYIFKDADNSCYCVIEISNIKSKLPQINGIGITYENLAQKGGEMKQFIQLKCSYETYLHQFCEIIKEIIADYDKGKGTMSASVSKIINKWKYFFSIPRLEILNEEQIIGLIGELIFLQKLIDISPETSVKLWTPERGDEDFIFPNKIIEVKTTDKDRHEHIINGIDQLKISDSLDKFILSILIASSEDDEAITLPSLVSDINTSLANHPESNDLFLHKLRHRSYDIRDSEEYNMFRYRFIRGALFLIDEFFPKLTTEELCKPLISRVSKVRYTIDIDGLESIDFNDIDFNPYALN